jgi:hypothetical protein
MTNLHEHLDRIAGPVTDTPAEQAAADLSRGRRALRRRRAVQSAGASVFAVAALAAAVTYGTTTSGGGDGGESVAGNPPPAATSPQTASTKLVAYKGKQPKGFTLDKVPDGWEVQGVTQMALTLAPVGFGDQEPDSFEGKIAVMLQSQDDHSTPEGEELTVAGQPAVLGPIGVGGVEFDRNLWVRQKDGVWMQIQVWDFRGWTEDSIVEFAEGIHVLPGAQRGRG